MRASTREWWCAGSSWTAVGYMQPSTQSEDITADTPASFPEEQFEDLDDAADAEPMSIAGDLRHVCVHTPLAYAAARHSHAFALQHLNS